MSRMWRDADGNVSTTVVVALIGGLATVLAAVVGGVFALMQVNAAQGDDAAPAAAAQPAAPTTAPSGGSASPSPSSVPAVEVSGPDVAPLGTRTYFTIVAPQATRVEWAIAGFGDGELTDFDVSDQVFVEPTDAERVGDEFVLVVTAYDAAERASTGRHTFVVAAAG